MSAMKEKCKRKCGEGLVLVGEKKPKTQTDLIVFVLPISGTELEEK